MSLREEIHRRREAVLQIAARHHVARVRLFGSVARGEEGPDSDIDLLVDLDENCRYADYLGFIEEIEDLLARRVEVVISRSLSPHFRPFVEAEAQAL